MKPKKNNNNIKIYSPNITTFDLGEALRFLRAGHAISRKSWAPGSFLMLQKKDAKSKMTENYIYRDTVNVRTSNPNFIKGRMPWNAGNDDLLATDYILVEV